VTWFIAIGAVIVLGAVAGATWDQRKGRSGSARTGHPGGDMMDPSRPSPPAGNSRHEFRLRRLAEGGRPAVLWPEHPTVWPDDDGRLVSLR